MTFTFLHGVLGNRSERSELNLCLASWPSFGANSTTGVLLRRSTRQKRWQNPGFRCSPKCRRRRSGSSRGGPSASSLPSFAASMASQASWRKRQRACRAGSSYFRWRCQLLGRLKMSAKKFRVTCISSHSVFTSTKASTIMARKKFSKVKNTTNMKEAAYTQYMAAIVPVRYSAPSAKMNSPKSMRTCVEQASGKVPKRWTLPPRRK
mmetsp:Transcript_47721/g.111562  ORF Transcript_47721/g.111562 Transcript_47721/m.111562 type:complete len:207 (-) Transcript_47721:197-817(-)